MHIISHKKLRDFYETPGREDSSKQQYEYALKRIEELLPLVTDETPLTDKNSIELTLVSDVVEAYEKLHYPIAKPTIGELISLSYSASLQQPC